MTIALTESAAKQLKLGIILDIIVGQDGGAFREGEPKGSQTAS